VHQPDVIAVSARGATELESAVGANGAVSAYIVWVQSCESHCRQGRCRFIVDSMGGQALTPPSTVRLAPLMKDDSGPATNATSAATSSAFP
jgi:hypothetical protein